MIHTLYIEDEVRDHPLTQQLRQRYPKATTIACHRYTEVFNRKAQNFRLQKQRPALILAKKFKNFVLETPPNYGIGGTHNYYFSHLMNCIYDCRYCFLQGMYRSAHYVLFVNYEDFEQQIRNLHDSAAGQDCYFFSGYDCDSLALEPVTHFAQRFLPLFRELPNAWLELRTKSTQIRPLLECAPFPNCVVAFSLSPQEIAQSLEHKTPGLGKRIEAMQRLQSHGWQIGLRFDPIIIQAGFQASYQEMFAQVFSKLDHNLIHSASLGAFRLPDTFYRNVVKLYPDEPLFAGPLAAKQGQVAYRADLEQQALSFCAQQILHYLPKSKFFPCHSLEPNQ